MKLLAVTLLAVLTGCATSKGNERQAQHSADQIKMVAIQREARLQEKQAQAEANAALFEALSEVAKAAPEQAGSVAVALAVIGVRGASEGSQDAPTIALQQQRNDALQWAQVLAPTVGNLVSGLGVAAINGQVQKNASDNMARVNINDAEQDARIVEAIAGLGSTAVANTGMSVGGSYYDMEGSAAVDQSQVTTTDASSQVATTTSQDTTTTNTTNNTTTTAVSLNTTLNYEGADMTLAELISQLNAAGATYSIDVNGDGTPDVTGDGEGAEVKINCGSTFGPLPSECTGG